MKKIMMCFLPVVLMAIGMVSCQKEKLTNGIIRARVEHFHNKDSKVSFDMSDGFQWQTSDNIRVRRKHDVSTYYIGTYTVDASSVSDQSEYAIFTHTSGTDVTANGEGGYLAYCPASISEEEATSNNANNLITIPQLQTATADGKMQCMPMYAKSNYSEAPRLDFKNLCGILRLHLTGSTDDVVSKIELKTDENKPIAGLFALQASNTDAPYITTDVLYSTTTNHYSTVELSTSQNIGSGKDFYIYLPQGDYPKMEITIETNDGRICKKVFDGSQNGNGGPTAISIIRSQYTSVTFSDLTFSFPPYFSVGNNVKVFFSPGNLQYDIDNTTWKFASNDYVYLGAAYVHPTNTSYSSNTNTTGVIDLFGWGTGDDVTDETERSSFADWGSNQIQTSDGSVSYPANTWRTLTYDEWNHLLNSRTCTSTFGSTTTNARFVKAKVNGKNGLILFPDVYNHPEGVTTPSNINSTSNISWSNVTSYNADDWAAMKENGAVFLPAAGWISYATGNYSNNNDRGCYWSSTPSNSQGGYLNIQSGNSYPKMTYGNKKQRYCVRLVRNY